MPDRAVITRAIENSWSANTSAHRRWTPDNPPLGQSGVTARAVKELLGGEIMHRTVVVSAGEEWAHFSNVVDGEDIDLTIGQYDEHAVFVGEKQSVTTEELETTYGVGVRYDTLMGSVRGYLFELAHSRRPGDPK